MINHVEVPVYKEVELIREKIVPLIEQREVIKPVDVITEKIVESRVEVAK